MSVGHFLHIHSRIVLIIRQYFQFVPKEISSLFRLSSGMMYLRQVFPASLALLDIPCPYESFMVEILYRLYSLAKYDVSCFPYFFRQLEGIQVPVTTLVKVEMFGPSVIPSASVCYLCPHHKDK
jgi:hypothetical protein